MRVGEITRSGILQAIEEHDQLGKDEFRSAYGFREALSYVLVYEGREYDSKAIAGVAHRYDFGRALKPQEFSGGKKHAVAWLEREGFTVTKPPKTFLERVGDVRPPRQRTGVALHRPLLLLWAIGQAVTGAPRLQPWSATRKALAPLLEEYAHVENGAEGAQYPFGVLVRDGLWTVSEYDELALTSQRRRPTLESLNRVDPLAGFLEDDHQLIKARPELAAEAAAGLLLRYFHPLPSGLLGDLRINELLGTRWADALHPLTGERFKDRDAIWRTYGGQKVQGIGCLADGILSVFSDDKGPYADGRLPDTGWIAYVGDGLSGDQQLVKGNAEMAKYQSARRPLRYWHKPFEGQFSFETWVVIVQCRLRWGRGDDKEWRREFVWILAPVPSPMPQDWPTEVVDALNSGAEEFYDDTQEYQPADIDLTAPPSAEPDHEAYQRLTRAAEASASRRGATKRPSTVDRYMRSQSARAAVIRRSRGNCENPQCAGHPTELTTAGEPILQVDHVRDLAKGGADLPWNMIALCPNCHALKTYGVNRETLRIVLRDAARQLHEMAGRAAAKAD